MTIGAATLISVLCLATPVAMAWGCGADCPDDVLGRMVESDSSVQAGTCPDPSVGPFVMSLVNFDATDRNGFDKARLEASRLIGGYLGAKVESEISSRFSESTDAAGKSVAESMFSDYSSIQVNQAIKGIESYAVRTVGDRTKMAFILSKGVAARATELAAVAEGRRSKGDGPVLVYVTGVATISGGDVKAARSEARDSALQAALEQATEVTIVGKTFAYRQEDDAGDREEFRSMVFRSFPPGVVEIQHEDEPVITERPPYLTLKITAKVDPKRILDSYRELLDSLGDPEFRLEVSEAPELADLARAFFVEKGLRIQEEGERPEYLIRLKPKFENTTHPIEKTPGTVCTFTAELVRLEGGKAGRILFAYASRNKASSFNPDGPERQKGLAAEAAWAKAKNDIHAKLNETITRLVTEGSEVSLEVGGLETGSNDRITGQLAKSLSEIPGIKVFKPEIRPGGRWSAGLRTKIPVDALARIVAAELRDICPDRQVGIESNSSASGIKIDMKKAATP